MNFHYYFYIHVNLNVPKINIKQLTKMKIKKTTRVQMINDEIYPNSDFF